MVVLDASVVIDYLAGDDETVDFIEERASSQLTTIPLVLFEVYQGEIFKQSPADFDELEQRLTWLTVLDTGNDTPRSAAALQTHLHEKGAALAPRDAFIAGAAYRRNDRLAHRDSDFDVDALEEEIDVLRV